MSTSTDRYLHEHRAWNWQWPDERNRFDTRLPVVKPHANAVECNYTPLPGCACKRQLRRARARNNDGRRARAD